MMALSAALLLTACGEYESEQLMSPTDKKTITFDFGELSLRSMTRATLAELNLTDLWIFDYVGAELKQTIHQASTDASFGSASLSLDYGEHTLCFVASRGSEPTVTAPTISWVKPSDTFWAALSLNVQPASSASQSVTLHRVATRLRIAITDEIENYPGQIVEGESGPSLIARMSEQAKKFGAERVSDVIKSVELEGSVKKLVGAKGEYYGKTVILATGAFPRPIGCKNEGKFVGKGISFCATCDANFFEDFEVFVVGGGDSAVEEAMYLTKFARKVSIIHRRDELRAAKSIQEKAFKNPKMNFIWDTVVEEVDGDELLNKMVLKNVKTGELTTYEADEEDGLFGLFGFIGMIPNSGLFEGIIDMERGYIKTDDNMHTNIPGVYAAGDIRVKSLRQVVTAAADGAIAAMQAEKYLAEME